MSVGTRLLVVSVPADDIGAVDVVVSQLEALGCVIVEIDPGPAYEHDTFAEGVRRL